MIDYFALALTHGLLVIALFRLMRRDDLDADSAVETEGDAVAETGSETRREARARRRRNA